MSEHYVEAETDTLRLEISPTSGQHRLVDKSNPERRTPWASYKGYTFMNGMVGATPYYLSGNKAQIITPEEFMRQSATCVEVQS